MKMIFLVDGDNNIGTGLQGADQLTGDDSILIFYQKTGLALSKIKELCKGSRASIQYLESVKGGKNSIDFQIITELGVLVGRGEADCAYVISQDKGYEAAMSALRTRYAGAFREVALRPSIAACLKSSYLLRADSSEELKESLMQEFGDVQGAMAFEHLQTLFHPIVEKEPEKTAEKPAVKRPHSRRRPAANSKKPKSVEQEAKKEADTQPVSALLLSVPSAAEQEPQKPAVRTARTHRGGRRKKKPAVEKSEEKNA